MLCVFFTCVATIQDPLSHFGMGPAREVVISYDDSSALFIRDIHIKNNRIYVFLINFDNRLIRHGIIREYDMAGNVLQEVEMVAETSPIFFAGKVQILWEEDFFYVPGFVSRNKIIGTVQKYNYQIELQRDFGENGTIFFSAIDYNLSYFSSVASAGNKYFAGGMISTPVLSPTSYLVLDFNSSDGAVNHCYVENVNGEALNRGVDFLEAYYDDSRYYLVGISFDHKLIYQEVNENSGLSFQELDEICVDYIVPVDKKRTQFYGIDNIGHYVYLITVTLGAESVFKVEKVADIHSFESNNYPWVSSCAIKKDTLLLGGGYDTTVANSERSTPFVLAYNITKLAHPVLDTRYFEEGKWLIDREFSGDVFSKSGIFFLRNNPYSFLLGYRSSIFHIVSPKGFYVNLDDIKKSKVIGFIS
jgi:hypothetical protein